MLVDNKALFAEFTELSDDFRTNPKKYNDAFKELRLKVLRIIKKNEDKLCARSETTHFSAYSQGLADKFWEEIRLNFPMIDASTN